MRTSQGSRLLNLCSPKIFVFKTIHTIWKALKNYSYQETKHVRPNDCTVPYILKCSVRIISYIMTELSVQKTSNLLISDRCLHQALWGQLWTMHMQQTSTHMYNYHIMSHRMSSSFSGKLQKAIRNCNCSGTGGRKCSTTSNGICRATAWAVSSTNDEIWPSTILKVNQCQQNLQAKINICITTIRHNHIYLSVSNLQANLTFALAVIVFRPFHLSSPPSSFPLPSFIAISFPDHGEGVCGVLKPSRQTTLGKFWAEKVLLVTAILVQFIKLLHQCTKPKCSDGENCKREADIYPC